jgi:transcriptional regulator with GAF, ATPase, and Fis domain
MPSQWPITPRLTESDAAPSDCLTAPALAFRPDIVLCDSDPVRGSRIKSALSGSVRVAYHARLESARLACQVGAPPLILLPFGPTGAFETAATLEFLRTFARTTAVLVYADTANLPIGLYCQPLAAGARQVLNEQSPTFLEDLTGAVERLAQDLGARLQEQQQLGEIFASCGMIGNSAPMREVFRRAIKAGNFSDLPVLILGETGTGKQRLAEAIHALDPRRRDKPFITINCAALTKGLAESELFGHGKGAFSGAHGERKGLFRAANGGTLMLDEVGELDIDLQPKLLRVLQERRLLPVGEDYEHPLDVRVIAATNRPLDTMIAEGRFREDLYQRLNVFLIQLPALRERPEDVALQARHFLAEYQKGRAEPITDFEPRVMEVLCSLPWEGNTRQLENLIREALTHRESKGPLIEIGDLPRWVFEKVAESPACSVALPASLNNVVEEAFNARLPLSQAVEEYERRLLALVLAETGGNRTRAAHRLGLTPRTIFTKIKKYQLD